MKKLSLIALFLSACVSAQNYQITYNLKFKPDSLADYTQTFPYILQIEKNETKFFPQELIDKNEQIKLGDSKFVYMPLNQTTVRSRNNDNYLDYLPFSQHYYAIQSANPIKWSIDKETRDENGYKLQKATTTFGKRNWTAWFIPEIPLSEGPYKFHGLPGLIYEISDDKGNFVYSMSTIKKMNKLYDTSNIVETHFGSKAIPVNLAKYQQIVLDNYNNPYAEYRGMKEGRWSINLPGDRVINTNKGLDGYIKEYQAGIRKRNNPVDLTTAVYFKE